jgi:dipeptidyl aminopeptidase/acylaminoacyl peptidase
MKNPRAPLGAIALLLAAAIVPGARAADTPPGPEKFFQHPRLVAASLSPDGQTVAMMMATSSTSRVRLYGMDVKSAKITPLAAFEDADIAGMHWVNPHRLVFELDDRNAPEGELDSASGLYGVNTDGSAMRQLVSRQGEAFFQGVGIPSRILPWNTWFVRAVDGISDDVYVYHAEEIDEKHSDYLQLQRLNSLHGHVADVATPPHTFQWIFDPKGELRVVVTDKGNHSKVMAHEPGGKEWVTLGDFEHYVDDRTFRPSYIDQNGTLFVETRNGRDKTAVWTYDLARRQLADKPWLVSPTYDLNPDYVTVGGKLAGLSFEADAWVTQWVAPELTALQSKVDKLLPTTTNHLDVADNGNLDAVLVLATSDRVPGLWFLLDQAKGKLIKLGASMPDIDPKTQATLEPVHYAARDGLEIPAWLTVPAGAERKNLPLVVLVHGGPNVRGRSWDWDPETQFLAARGYAVLEPEFRGSTGYGWNLFHAGWKQWGLAMQDDVADGVKWAVAQGIVDPKRVCIAGASYGGYSVLMGLARDPDLYRCGIDWVGVTDMNLMYTADWSDTSDAAKQYGMPLLIGDPVTDAAQLKATSPTNVVARIHAPILMAYGGKDRRVPIEHGELFRDALKKQPGAKVEWVVYGKEGHGWRAVDTRIDFWNRVARFLDANIGAH